MYWILYLYHMIQNSNKNILHDENVISTKNKFIYAMKKN